MKTRELLSHFNYQSIDEYFNRIVQEYLTGHKELAINLIATLNRNQKFECVHHYYRELPKLGKLRKTAMNECLAEVLKQLQFPVRALVEDRRQLKLFNSE